MINNIDTWAMLNDLYANDVPVQINEDWDDEEFHNYIVHKYDVFMCPPDWKFAAETAELVLLTRRGPGYQPWRKAFKPGAQR